jgi:hypothetical protein
MFTEDAVPIEVAAIEGCMAPRPKRCPLDLQTTYWVFGVDPTILELEREVRVSATF